VSQIIQNQETVTLRSRQAGSPVSYLAYTVARVRRKSLTKDQELAFAGVIFGKQIRVFQFCQALLDSALAPPPKASDEILDAFGVTWVVLHIEQKLCDQVYDCLCSVGRQNG